MKQMTLRVNFIVIRIGQRLPPRCALCLIATLQALAIRLLEEYSSSPEKEREMKRIFVLGLFCIQSLCADTSLDRYFSYMQQLAQPNGNFR